jgi:predicted PurR-regulated permease PerM
VAWRLVVIAAAIAVVAWVMIKIRVVVLPLAFALLLSTVLIPAQRWLRRLGIPALAATWLVFLTSIALVAGAAVWLVPLMIEQASQLGQSMQHGVDRIEQWLVNGPLSLSPSQAQGWFDNLRKEFTGTGGLLVSGVMRGTVLAVEMVAGALLTAVFTFFIVKDGETFARHIISMAEDRHQPHALEIGRRTWQMLSGYVLGTTLNGVVNGTLMAVALLIWGVPLILPLAFVTFLGAYVPIVGALVSGALAALVALAAKGWGAALGIAVATIVIHHVEGYLVGPVVLGRAVRLRPAAVVAALAVGGTVAGLAGAMLAVPTAAFLATLVTYRREIRDGT